MTTSSLVNPISSVNETTNEKCWTIIGICKNQVQKLALQSRWLSLSVYTCWRYVSCPAKNSPTDMCPTFCITAILWVLLLSFSWTWFRIRSSRLTVAILTDLISGMFSHLANVCWGNDLYIDILLRLNYIRRIHSSSSWLPFPGRNSSSLSLSTSNEFQKFQALASRQETSLIYAIK